MDTNLEQILLSTTYKECAKQVEAVVCYILKRDDHISEKKKISANKIIEKYNKLRGECALIPRLEDSTLRMYISRASNDPQSKIYKNPQTQGYFYNENVVVKTTSSSDDSIIANTYSESDFYPIFLKWLAYSCSRVEDIHTEKKQKLWGNPDLIGITISDIVGVTQIDITTLEVKKNLSDWRKNIFEAVSHTRFVHKSYFAFVCTQIEFAKERAEMIQHAMQFGIGLLVLFRPERSKDKRWMKPEKIEEILPAPTRHPANHYLQMLLENLCINGVDKICEFGKRAVDLDRKKTTKS